MKIKKRNGSTVDFDKKKIVTAINKAMSETKSGIDEVLATKVAALVESETTDMDTVEAIQNRVEKHLFEFNRDVAMRYIQYRTTRERERGVKRCYNFFDDEFLSRYKHMPSPMDELGNFVYYRTYSRYLAELGRREYWWETVARAVDYNCSLVETTTKEEAKVLYDNVFHLRQFLSGRTLWTGGTEVSKLFPMSNFNCAFQVVDTISAFHDLLYLLMIGSGVGVRITEQDVAKLPNFRNNYTLTFKEYEPIKNRYEFSSLSINHNVAKIVVGDSKNGWSDAMKFFMSLITESHYRRIEDIIIDFNSVRPAGEKLKTFGGTASGHEALLNMFKKIDKVFKNKEVSDKIKIKPIDCMDICNIIGEGVVVGGVRRTAEIVLFDPTDRDCLDAKSNLYTEVEGNWIVNQNLIHRSMSNNSIYYESKPERAEIKHLLEKMRYSGEPGFVNAEAASKRRVAFKGVNPCAEILLDSKGMCNLTTVNVMAFVQGENLDIEGLIDAQALSARSGYRMTMVELELPEWDVVQQRDKLIGCSLTGWQDMVNAVHMPMEDQAYLLKVLRDVAQMAAEEYAESLNSHAPILVTTVKPEGTLSQLPVVSSGVHYSHSPYYIRRIRVNSHDPIVKVCEELGYPVLPEVGQEWDTCKTKVVEFPVKAPEGTTKNDVSAIEQLENYKMFMENYVDHNCSITVHVRDHEWEEVEEWLWEHWDDVVAVSFLSLDDNFYDLLPYEEITVEQYNERKEQMVPFVPALISKYETDEVVELLEDACASGSCPIR